MEIDPSVLEEEFFDPEAGFQIIEPKQRRPKRPKGNFLKRKNSTSKSVADSSDVLIRVSDLRAIDSGDLKESVFHRLWVTGYVDRKGKGTDALLAAVLEQAAAFEGTLKCSDSEIIEFIARKKTKWPADVARKFGLCSLHLAASLQKAGWFDADGTLNSAALNFLKTVDTAKAVALASKVTIKHLELLFLLEDFRKDYPIERAEGCVAAFPSWDEDEKAIYWFLANKIIDERWRPTEFGYLVMKIRFGESSAA